jgi:hypothetical protein
VWIDNSLVIDQRLTSGSQSGTISLLTNTLFEIEVEYKHFGNGLANMDITISTATLYYAHYDSFTRSLTVNAEASATCQLVAANALVTIITFGVPVSFSLSCEDQFKNTIKKVSDISVLIISEDIPTTTPIYSKNVSFSNSLVVISSVVFCCVSKFSFRIGVDDTIFNSPSFEAYFTRSWPPVESNTLIVGSTILTSGFAAVFTIYSRDVFNRSTTFENSSLSHMTVSFANFSKLHTSSYSVGSTPSILLDAQMLFLTPYVTHNHMLIHHQICKSGYLVRIFSSDQPSKASWIYEFVLSSIKDLNVHS